MPSSFFEFFANVIPVGSTAVLMTVGAVAWYFSKISEEKKIKSYVPLDDQSNILPGEEQARISKFCKDGKPKSYVFENVRTMADCFYSGLERSNDGPCLGRRSSAPDGSRPYTWLSYSEVMEKFKALSKFYVKLGLAIGQQTNIGIYSRNRPEWIISEHACYVYSMVNVPLYDTLGEEAVCYVINQTDMMLIVCESSQKVELLMKNIDKMPSLRFLILLDPLDEELSARAKEKGIQVFNFEECLREGDEWAENAPEELLPKPEDLATICYTSGTTGMPKGVMLTHSNLIADSTVESVFVEYPVISSDVIISYLPLAHMFERIMEFCTIIKGARVGYYSGDVKKLVDDVKELRPTLMPIVPRLMNRIYDKIVMEAGKNVLKKFIFDLAFASKLQDVQNSIIRKNTIWDRLVFNNIRQQFGGCLRVIVAGSAPASKEVMNMFRVVFNCIVAEGYGQTECVAAATLTVEGDYVPSQVGPPMPGNMIKMVDVAEMNYYAKNGCGEVCIKGPNVFKGYYKDPERTAEVLDADGWLHTGDIGKWTDRGSLQLIDRKKHLFKLAQGEYIAPEKVENVYLKCKFIAQVFVHGDSLKSCVVGVVVPDVEVIQKTIASQFGLSNNSKEICRNEAVKKYILEDMVKEGKKAKLCSFEQVKDIHLHPELFSVENNLLTPTFKAKRTELRQRFKEQIDEMYNALN